MGRVIRVRVHGAQFIYTPATDYHLYRNRLPQTMVDHNMLEHSMIPKP